jgi:O-antigen/teichoic acid export membrane protein
VSVATAGAATSGLATPGLATAGAASVAPHDGELAGIARGGLISLGGSVIAAVAGLVMVVVVGRTLGTSGAGLFFQTVAVVLILANVCELGADTGLVRALPRLRALHHARDIRPTILAGVAPSVLASAAAALGLWFAAPWLADLLYDAETVAAGTSALRVAAPFLLVAAPMVVVLAATRGLGSVVPVTAVSSVAIPVLRTVLLVVGATLFGTAGAVLGWALPLAGGLVVALVVCHRQVARAESSQPAAPAARGTGLLTGQFWRFTGPRGVSAALEIAIVWADVLIVGIFRSPAEAGVYAVVSRFVTSGTMAEAAMRVAIAPRLSALLAVGDRRSAEDLSAAATQWIIAASWPLFLLLALFAPVVLGVVGPGFATGAVALSVLAGAMMVSLAAGNVHTVLLMGGRSSWHLANKAGALTLIVGLGSVLVPTHGIVGAAVAWAVAMVVETAAALVEVRFLLGLRPSWSGAAVAAGLALGCVGLGGLGMRALMGATATGLAATVLVTGAAYLCGLWLLRARMGAGILAAAAGPRGTTRI